MRPLPTLILTAVVFLAGCAEMKGLLIEAHNSGMIPPPRDYITNPVTLAPPPPTTQPNFETFGNTPSDDYQTILVNTQGGMVYKRCKVLKGRVVACL
jgi:hypothetical protein